MGSFEAWLAVHPSWPLFVGAAAFVVGAVLVVIGLRLRRVTRRNVVAAKSGAVAIGRDNSGIVVTGGMGETSERTDRLRVIANWATILGLVVAVVGVVVAYLAWIAPPMP